MTQKTDSKPTALFLMGPTASGKTDLAIQLRPARGSDQCRFCINL